MIKKVNNQLSSQVTVLTVLTPGHIQFLGLIYLPVFFLDEKMPYALCYIYNFLINKSHSVVIINKHHSNTSMYG